MAVIALIAVTSYTPAAGSEARETYTGPANVVVMDDFQQGTSSVVYEFRDHGVRVLARQSSLDAPDVRCGDVVQLEGTRMGASMMVDKASVVSRKAAGEGCESTGPQEVAVILATFPGVTLPARQDAIQALLFDPTYVSAHTWLRDQSYGKLSLSGSVFGPYTLDRGYTCDETEAMRAAAIRAADADIDFTRYRRYILIFPPIANCYFGGMGTRGCGNIQTGDGTVRASWAWLNYNPNFRMMLKTVVHELGHNLGVGHSRLLRFPEATLEADDHRAAVVEYGDQTAIMGSGAYGDFAASHKLELGWLDAASVIDVERDGDFVLAPLSAPAGVRSLRVRRHAGSDEWLWIEFRRAADGYFTLIPEATHSGYRGLVIRRETAASGASTHLLDMTPPTLNEAAWALGRSDADPDLSPGATWSDPDGEVTIAAGEIGPDGMAVSVRYNPPCASPRLTEVTLEPEQLEFTVPVDAGPECTWTARSERNWIRTAIADSGVKVSVEPLAGTLTRTGVVSIGRKTIQVTQRASAREMTVLSVAPPGTTLPVEGWMPFVIYLRDENGVAEMPAIQISVSPRPGSAALPCYFRYSSRRKVVEASDDGLTFRDSESPSEGMSGSCGLRSASIYEVNETDIMLRFSLRFNGNEGEAVSVGLRVDNGTPTTAPWTTAVELTATRQCRALPTVDWVYYVAYGMNDTLPVVPSSLPCAWTASADADWIQLRQTSGDGSEGLQLTIARNTASKSREGHIVVNGTPVRVTQYGNGEILPRFVTLTPKETVVTSLFGLGIVYFRYSLAPLVPATSESDWLRVTRVVRSGNSQEVHYVFDENPLPTVRHGTLVIGGQRFDVMQQAGGAN